MPDIAERHRLSQAELDTFEEIKSRIGHEGTDRRVAIKVLEARPDLKSISVENMAAAIKITLDRTLHDALTIQGFDASGLEREFEIQMESQWLIVTGEANYRVRTPRPRNKRELQKDIKREASVAIRSLYNSGRRPPPEEFINEIVEEIGRKLARVFLDSRITNHTIATLRRTVAPGGTKNDSSDRKPSYKK